MGSGAQRGQQMEARVRELATQLASLARVRSFLDVAYVRSWGPLYTCYLFTGTRADGLGVTRQYGHKMGSGTALPEIVVTEGGNLWKHADKDYTRLMSRTGT